MINIVGLFMSGLIAALTMAGFLLLMEQTRVGKSDMFWTMGSLFSNRRRNARAFALTMHICAALVFTVIYVSFWSLYLPLSTGQFVAFGAMTGLIHGLAVAVALILILINRKNGFGVGLTSVGAHVIFGLTLGILISYLQETRGVVTSVARILDRLPIPG